MSDRDRRQPQRNKRRPLFDHLEDVEAPRLRTGPPAPLGDMLSDIDEDLPVRDEPLRTSRPAQSRQPAPAQREEAAYQRPAQAQTQRSAPVNTPAARPVQNSATRAEQAAPLRQSQAQAATATRQRTELRPVPRREEPDFAEVHTARRAYEDVESDLHLAEQMSARPYVSYTAHSDAPIFSLGQPVMLAMIAIVSILVIVVLGGGNASQLWSSWSWGGRAVNNDEVRTAAQGTPGDYSLLATPSINAEQIDRILASYGSPASGTGKIWHDLGQQYGIDPAFAVAFFIMESSAGTAPGWAGWKPDGSSTHNVGNIICAGYARCHNRFRDYGSWEEGINDWYRLIDVEYIKGRGTITLQEIIPIYAPSFENDVDGYIGTVARLVDGWRTNGVP
jgi:hypothetical protein